MYFTTGSFHRIRLSSIRIPVRNEAKHLETEAILKTVFVVTESSSFDAFNPNPFM
jgi:hypothetical protein